MLSQGRHCNSAVAFLQVDEACTDECLSSTEVSASFNLDCSADHFCSQVVWACVAKHCAGLRSVEQCNGLAGWVLNAKVSVLENHLASDSIASFVDFQGFSSFGTATLCSDCSNASSGLGSDVSLEYAFCCQGASFFCFYVVLYVADLASDGSSKVRVSTDCVGEFFQCVEDCRSRVNQGCNLSISIRLS